MLAITVPAIFLSAISFAKFGPLKTPILLLNFLDKTSDSVLNGSSRIPFVQEIMITLLSRCKLILFIICSKIRLGVATKIIDDPLITSSRLSEASIFLESFSSG